MEGSETTKDNKERETPREEPEEDDNRNREKIKVQNGRQQGHRLKSRGQME